MYGASDAPLIWLQEWFSITMTKAFFTLERGEAACATPRPRKGERPISIRSRKDTAPALNAAIALIGPFFLDIKASILSKGPRTNVSYFSVLIVIPPTTRNRIGNCLVDFVARKGSQAINCRKPTKTARTRREWEDGVVYVVSPDREAAVVAAEGRT